MRQIILLAVVLLLSLVFSSAAQTKVIEGTNNGDVLNGTAYGDKIYGYGGADTINAKSGGDLGVGGAGADTLDMGCGYDNPQGGDGEDLIYVDCADGKPDFVQCGDKEDIVFWRVEGTTFSNCENKIRVTSSGDVS